MPTATVTDVNGAQRLVDAGNIQRAIGKKGVSIWGGFVREEYLPQLAAWGKQARLFLEMRDDPTVGALLNAIKLPLLAAEISVKPKSGNGPDIEAAKFLRENIDNMHRQSWRAYTEDALECLDFGFALSEVIMEKRRDGNMWLRNLEPRGQETVRKWLTPTDDSDEIIGFEQAPFRGGDLTEVVKVPIEKCVHVVYRGRKGNPQGRALLRSLYTPYVFVKNLRTFEGIGIERDIGGTPVLKLPAGITSITGTEYDALRDQLDGLKVDETLWITLPDGMEIEPFASGAKSTNIREVIRDHQKDMMKVAFAQFLELGMDSAGTQALVQGSQDFFSLGLKAVQAIVLESWNQQLVPLMFRFNRFPGMTGYPEFVWAPPGQKAVDALVKMYAEGVNAKVLTATRKDEEFIRSNADLPKLEAGEGEQDRSPTPPNPFPGMGPQIPGQPRQPGQEGQQPPQGQQGQPGQQQPQDGDPRKRPPMNGQRPTPQFSEEHPAGQDLRTIPGIYEHFTNTYQRDLVTAYDEWARETSRQISLNEKTFAQINDTIVGRLDQLTADLKVLGRRNIAEASGLGMGDVLGKHAQRPEVQSAIAKLIADNDRYIDDALIPSIKERALQGVPEVVPLKAAQRRDMMLSVLTTRRARVAQGAGGAVTAIFEPQKVAGMIENRERRLKGEAPVAVRWVLDDRAEHCADDPKRATFGCPELARVYADGWDSLPTVPASNTTCMGNCRCQLWADFEGTGNWQRIT